MHTPEKLRASCEALFREIDFPEPFTICAFAQAISQYRGRQLHLHDMPRTGPGDQPYGAWIATDAADHIFCVSETSPVHRTHIVLHEIAHMLCDHAAEHGFEHELAEAVFPDLAPDVLTGMLRHSYATETEREAETLACLMLDQIERRARRQSSTTAWRRLKDALDHPIRGFGDG